MFDEKFNIDIDGDGISDFSLDLQDTNDDNNTDLWLVDIDTDGDTDFALLDTNENGILDSIDFDGASYDNGFDDSYEDSYNDDDSYEDYSDSESDEYVLPDDYELPDIDFDSIEFEDDVYDDSDSDSAEEYPVPDSDYDYSDDDDEFSEYDSDDDDDHFTDDDVDDDDDNFTDNEDVIDFDTYEDSESDIVDYDDDDGKIYGNPDTSDDYWEFQGSTNRCAIYSQKFIIEEFTGEDLDIEVLTDIAEDNGWFTESSGTPICYMNKLLDYYGVENESGSNNSMNDIEECLDNGGKVIVAIDADEIWYEDDDIYDGGYGVNHAVEVIGVDHTDPENPVVILNDSGTPNGQGSRIPLDVFEDAWIDGDNYMVACN